MGDEFGGDVGLFAGPETRTSDSSGNEALDRRGKGRRGHEASSARGRLPVSQGERKGNADEENSGDDPTVVDGMGGWNGGVGRHGELRFVPVLEARFMS